MRRFGLLSIGIVVIALLTTSLCYATLSGSLSEKQIILRLQPEAEVTVEAGSSMPTAKPTVAFEAGQQRYEEVCHICHGTGIGGAPKFGDKDDWAPRIAEGIDVLLKHALEGYKAMPVKGTCMNCTDDEIKKSIEYMISKSK